MLSSPKNWLILLACLCVLEIGCTSSDQRPEEYAQETTCNQDIPCTSSDSVSGGQIQSSVQNQQFNTEEKSFLYRLFDIRITDVLIVVFTAVLAWRTTGLFRETAGLRVAADKQAADFLRSVKATEEAAEAASLHAKAAVGADLPIIFVTNATLSKRGIANLAARLQYPKIEMIFQNFGRTPAFLLQRAVVIRITKNLPEEPVYRNIEISEYPPGRLLEKDMPELYTIESSAFADDEISDVVEGNKFLWVYGFLIYQDFIREFHEIGFCARWFAGFGTAPDVFGFGYGPPKYTYVRDRKDAPPRLNPELPPYFMS